MGLSQTPARGFTLDAFTSFEGSNTKQSIDVEEEDEPPLLSVPSSASLITLVWTQQFLVVSV